MKFWGKKGFITTAAPAAPGANPAAAKPKNWELIEQLNELKAERDVVLKLCAPLELEREKAHAKVAAAQAEYKAVGDKIAALKTQRYREVCNMIAVLTRAIGKTVSLQAEPGSFSVTPRP